jgi:hypothetical protein
MDRSTRTVVRLRLAVCAVALSFLVGAGVLASLPEAATASGGSLATPTPTATPGTNGGGGAPGHG